jgi:CHAT domain
VNDPADLELSLRRKDAVRYTVDLVFSQPGSEADVRPLGQQSVCVIFEMDRLREMALDPVGYGRALTEMLLGDPALATAFAQCRTAAQSHRMSLRLRLAIAPDAPELHAIRWGTLRDPQTDQPLALSEQILLTRALGSADWQPVTLRAKGDLRALVVIAAPAGLDRFNLALMDADVERQVALTGMSEIPATVLTAPGQASLPTLIRHLRDGYDILYLVAHGTVVDAHLLRAEERRGVTWYELAHDRLIAPVRQDNAIWFEAHLSALQRQARLWDSANRPDGLLLRGGHCAKPSVICVSRS